MEVERQMIGMLSDSYIISNNGVLIEKNSRRLKTLENIEAHNINKDFLQHYIFV